MTQVHRFRTRVAFRLGKGRTHYLAPDEAQEIAAALSECATDIQARTFTASQFGTRPDLPNGLAGGEPWPESD